MKEIIINNYKNILFLLIILFLILINKNLRTNNNISKQNIEALKDKVRVVKTKNGKNEFIIKSLVVKNKRDLKKLNDKLYNEIKDERGKVLTLTKFNTVIKYDTLVLKNTLIEYPDGYKDITWLYDTTYSKNNFKFIKGVSRFKINQNGDLIDLTTLITENTEGIEIVLGYKDNGDGIEFFARSEHPYFKVNNIESVMLTSNSQVFNKYKKSKRLFIGPYLGIGINNNLIITPSLGLGIGYNLNR